MSPNLNKNTYSENTIAAWHKIIKTKDAAGLDNILADNVVFHSPIVHTPQEGKPITILYLTAALYVFNNDSFKYLKEVISGNNAVLEFSTVIEGITVNGVDMITWGADGRITEFKVMVRPLKAINLIHKIMKLELQKQSTLKLGS
jgi:ketosteroid isomerase-like protein